MITPSSSSTHGLIHALKLTQQGSASAVELTADGDATWLHFDAADPETSQWLRSEGGLNMVAAGALTTEETRPRVLRRGDNLVLTLRGVNRLPGAEAEDMVSLRIWTNGSRLISARLRPLQSTDRLVDELLSGEGANTIPGLLVDWVEYVVDDMADSIASLELDVAAAEAAIDDADPTSTRQSIVVLRKRALQFRRYMAPQREALSRLSTETPTWLDEYHRVRLRDIA
ncbi:MAG TPA: zinc transporter ZntB, partial [Halieaceae bacterium]|nr:zinc transporter ZntB [Halieaceae bacterium]